MTRYGFFIGIIGAVLGLVLFAWRLDAFNDLRGASKAGGEVAAAAADPIGQAENAAAKVRVQQAVIVVEAVSAQNGTAAGLTTDALRQFDPTLDASVQLVYAGDTGYCVQAGYAQTVMHSTGPGTDQAGPCPTG